MSVESAPPPQHTDHPKGRRIISLRVFLLVLVTSLVATVSLAGWSDLYSHYLELKKPTIRLTDVPRGVGLTPVTFHIELFDRGAGLGQLIVRSRQKGEVRELVRRNLTGLNSFSVDIEFPGERSNLEEGAADLELVISDTSLWRNTATQIVPFKVDFSRPKVEVLSKKHVVQQGGSQLVFYRALDEELAVSGVKIGGQTSIGYPARGLDKELDEAPLSVALYALDLRTPDSATAVRIFAEDQVGNATSIDFPNRIQALERKRVAVPVSDDLLRGAVSSLADQNFQKLRESLRRMGENLEYHTAKGSPERLIEKFKLVNETLRRVNEATIVSSLRGPRFEAYWSRAFLKPSGTIQRSYGQQLVFESDGNKIGELTQLGVEIVPPRDNRDVVAANDGIVVFSDNIGVYGRTVAIDHGLGLVSLYGNLEQAFVSKGVAVSRGQRIATAGNTGLAKQNQLYFEIRVHGVPVNPAEWWDEGWFYSQVTEKIIDLKQQLGIPVYRPLS